jgi:selenocysteine-specific elongation factor
MTLRPNVTIGVAGHIDHGKTTLTKALTNIDTDRLIEEKKRNISIENGFAFLNIENGWRAAVIDVPGHMRFIRQMIAGVAGIDLVILVIAADEGVMPQTREHLDILRLLQVPNAMVAITKTALVDDDFLALVEDDIRELLNGTAYESAPFYKVDSPTGSGIEELRNGIITFAKTIKGRKSNEPFRLPIDDVFTIHGHGTIVRGTIFNGTLSMDSHVLLLPQEKPVRIKQLQVHHDTVQEAVAGQRVAVNIGGNLGGIKRGNVLVDSDHYQPTQRLDVLLNGLETLEKPIKQRGPVMVHLATSSVRGRVILFDRNRWEKGESIYAQLELEEPVVTKKGDRLIVRRPTPMETLGGGEVLNPLAVKHRFGIDSVREIETLAKGTPEDWVLDALQKDGLMTFDDLEKRTHIPKDELKKVIEILIEKQSVQVVKPGTFILVSKRNLVASAMLEDLRKFHQEYPLRSGMNRAEWVQSDAMAVGALKEAAAQFLLDSVQIILRNHVICDEGFKPHYPRKWEKRLHSIEENLQKQGLTPENWSVLLEGAQLPESIATDFRRFLIDGGQSFPLDEERLIDAQVFEVAVEELKEKTSKQFTVQEAKDILGLSRKHLIPFLELCDRLNLTKRQENQRVWQ